MRARLIPIGMLLAGFTFGVMVFSVFAQTWSGPSAAPAQGNTPAPLNVGGIAQAKIGGLTIGNSTPNISAMLDVSGGPTVLDGLGVFGDFRLQQGNFYLQDGTQADGRVLTYDGVSGKAIWKDLPGANNSGTVGGGCYSDGVTVRSFGSASAVGGACTCGYPYNPVMVAKPTPSTWTYLCLKS